MPQKVTALPTDEEVKFNLRVGKELYNWLVAYAHDEGRSTNAQIVQLIKEERARQQAAKQTPPSPPADDDQV